MERVDLGVVVYEEDGPLARIILNWPERANAQSSDMVHQFDDALGRAGRGYEIKVLIIKANGKGFCAGHAIGGDHYPEFEEGGEQWGGVWKEQSELFLAPMLRLWEFPKPTIAQVHGYALGGGTTGPWSRHHHRLGRRLLPDAAGPGSRLPWRGDDDRAMGVHELQACI